MRRYSLRRRLIAAVLLLECVLLAVFSVATQIYLWRAHMHSFTQVVRGRADSLLGQVHDAEDPDDNVAIDAAALDLRSSDVWMARDEGGRVLAQSPLWNNELLNSFGTTQQSHDFRLEDKLYRGLVVHGVRIIDAEDGKPGIPRPVTIYYAASLQPVLEAMTESARFLVFASLLLLALTGGVLAWLLRRGLAPLEELSLAAGEITPRQPRFQAPQSAHEAEELAVLATALEFATRRLEEAFRQQQVFVNDAAHELKTAVTIVKSSLQLLASRPRAAREYARGLETCLDDCARMEELAQRMLQLARFEQDPPGAVQCDLAEVTRDVAAQMERLAEIRQVTLSIHAPTPAMVTLAEEACASLVANLLLNAVQHTPSGGSVKAGISAGSAAILDIRDTGSGIAPEDLPHLFERFWRGDSSRARGTGGAGLGLSICKAIVDGCSGEIRIASRLGEGTCVTVRLPLAPPEIAAPETAQVSESVSH